MAFCAEAARLALAVHPLGPIDSARKHVDAERKLTIRGCGQKLGLVLCRKSKTLSVFDGAERAKEDLDPLLVIPADVGVDYLNELTLPLKNVSLAEWFNSDKENGKDENIKGALHARIQA